MSLVVFIVAVFCCYFVLSKYKLYLASNHIAGPWALPLLGNVQLVSKLEPQYLYMTIANLRAKYKETFRLWLGPRLWVFLHTPEETRDALNDSSLQKADTFQQLRVLIGNGLLISEGKYWQDHRRILGPAFHPNILHSFVPAICEHSSVLLSKLQLKCGQSIEVSEYLFPYMLDVILDTSMGKRVNSQSDSDCVYTHAFHRANELLFKRMVNPLLAPDFIFKRTPLWRELSKSLTVIHELMDTVIQERANHLRLARQTAPEASAANSPIKKSRMTLLDTLLTSEIAGQPLSLQEIRDEVNTFVLAGVDTTTAAMSFVIYALAKYPSEQAKLYAEFLSLDSPIEEVSTSDLCNLECLDMFIKECLRLYTIVPLTGRQTTCDTKIGQRVYCAGTTLWINMYGLAHDPELFEAPYDFRPIRFSKAHQDKQRPFSYIPFSGGPHVCIGRKYSLLIMKILTIIIVQNFELSLAHEEEELILMAQMVLKSLNGINVIFRSR